MCEHISGVCQLVCKPRTHTRKSFTSSTVSSPVVSSVISALLFGESRPGDDNALCISSNTPDNGQRYDKENRVNAMNIPSNPDFWTSYCNTHTHTILKHYTLCTKRFVSHLQQVLQICFLQVTGSCMCRWPGVVLAYTNWKDCIMGNYQTEVC